MCRSAASVLHNELSILRTDGGASQMHADNLVIMDGATLSCAEVAAVARRGARVTVAPGGLERAAASHQAAPAAVGRHAFYGRTTGVGANGRVPLAPANVHGLRLLRIHAGGADQQR